jgi:hypothetical protein
MQRQITDREIQKAQEIYLMQSKPFIDRLNEIHKRLTPKIIKTETEVKVFYEETEEIVMLRKYLDELSSKIKADLESGRFL